MAVTWDRKHETDSTGTTGVASYDKLTGMYQITRTYWLDTTTQAAICDPGSTDTLSFTLTHPDGSTVTMLEVAREANRVIGGSSPQARMVVTYEGHVLGLIRINSDHGVKSAKAYADLDPAHYISVGGISVPRGIGAHNEGTNAYAPHTVLEVVQNVSTAWYAGTLFDVIQNRLNTVNEYNWQLSATLLPTYWFEGEWLYLGAAVTSNRDNTYTLIHRLDYDGIDYHKAPWRETVSTSEDVTVGGITKSKETATYGSVINAQTSMICGRTTAEMNDYPYAYTIYRFADIFAAEV